MAGNVVTLVRDGAKAIGKDDWAEMIEAQRQKVLDEAKSIDDRVRQEYEQYKNSDDLGQYLENNLNTLRNRVNNSSANVGDYRGILDSEKSESNKQDNNYIIPEYRQEIERINILNRSFESGNVSIIKEKDEERSIICGMIDGKPHGANIIIGKDGELIDVKLFDHGNEINLEGRELNVSRSVDDLGNEHYVTLLDGKKFGWEIAKDKDGNVESLFYDETGELNIKSVKILEQQYSKQELIEEMKNMQGNLPQLTGQYALSQVKCNLNLHNSHKENEDEGVEVSNSKSMKKFDERVAIKLATSKGDMGM